MNRPPRPTHTQVGAFQSLLLNACIEWMNLQPQTRHRFIKVRKRDIERVPSYTKWMLAIIKCRSHYEFHSVVLFYLFLLCYLFDLFHVFIFVWCAGACIVVGFFFRCHLTLGVVNFNWNREKGEKKQRRTGKKRATMETTKYTTQ